MRRLLLALGLIALALPAAAIEPAETLRNAVDGFIRPGFSQVAEEAASLRDVVYTLCGEPNETTLEASRNQFKSLVVAYSRVEFLRFGPLTEDSRLERMLFWPDRKGIALRQVQAILADYDETATELADLRKKSIAVQGLGALEYVLFGERSETLATIESDFRCRYALTITEALAATATELSNAWAAPHGIAEHLAYPQESNTDYRSVRESLEQLVGALSHGVENIRDTRLLPFLGREGETPKPKSALFWRSEMTVPAIRAGFEGMRDFLAASKIGLATAEDGRWVENTTNFEFGNALRAADLVKSPVAEALADHKQKQALDYMVIVTGSLQALLGEKLPEALGLSVGFSSLDGD
jgi:predicted lipoprotein